MGPCTLTYCESAQGWPSFYSYIPDWMIGMNKFFYSFKGGNLWRHNVNETRNNFYGVQYKSRVRTVFNDGPTDNKIFKTISIQGDAPWRVTLASDIQNTGFIEQDWFQKQEQVYSAHVRNSGSVPMTPDAYALRSLNGIGSSIEVVSSIGGTHRPVPPASTWTEIRFSINPLVDIGTILSVGDYMYFLCAPDNTVLLAGQVVEVNRNYPAGKNYVRINSSIANAQRIGENPYWMYVKNSVAESHGVLGHYGVIEMENDSTEKIELFVVETEVMKSYP